MDSQILTPTKKIYKACENLNLEWEQIDVDMIKSMYNNDMTLLEMSAVMSRHTDEIALLLIDLSHNGLILPRTAR